MPSLQEYAAGMDDVLRPHGEIDALPYYGTIARKLQRFLHGRELATRTWLPSARVPVVVKRGSLNPPLFVAQMAGAVTPELIEARRKYAHLEEAKHALSPEQALVWFYFVPRKLMGFHYATNREGEGREISRIFFDLDRPPGVSLEDAIEVASLLAQAAAEDELARELIKGDPLVSWTGNSFHVMLFLRQAQPASFYRERLEYTGGDRTMTDRWVRKVAGRAKVKVTGGHARRPGTLIVDPSQTPSGKLCRVPLGSLHMADAYTVDGVSVPLRPDMLHRSVVPDLLSYTPGRIIDELDELAGRLP